VKILVCLKQVAEPETAFELTAAPPALRLPPSARYQINSFDEFALEEALLIKEAMAGVSVDALSVGPARVEVALQRAGGMGADRALHILTGEDEPPDPLTTATWIAAWAREQNYDLILCGAMSQDAMAGLTGAMLAELMSLPLATSVVKAELRRDRPAVYVEREIEGGWRDCLELDLPALLTINSGINRPRYPSLSNLLRAKKQKPHTMDAGSLPAARSGLELKSLMLPSPSRQGLRLQGSVHDKAGQLVAMLQERALL
jgi:electron transfer flavoprotein beta subunit